MVVLFLWRCERMMLAFLVRCLAVGVEFVHALIAGVGQQFEMWRQGQAALLEQSKIVSFARADRHAQNLLMSLVNHELSFLGMAFLFAGVTPALFFWVWGRSMRCSLASTTITVRSKAPSCNTFLPGR